MCKLSWLLLSVPFHQSGSKAMLIYALKAALILYAPLAIADAPQEKPCGEKAVSRQSALEEKVKELQKEKLQAAKEEVETRRNQLEAGKGTLDFALGASCRLAIAQLKASDRPEDQMRALQTHFDETKQVEEINQARFEAGRIPIEDLLLTRYYRGEAEIWLDKVKAGKLKSAISANGPDGAKRELDKKLQKLINERSETAKAEVEARTARFEAGQGTLDFLLGASRRLMVAEIEMSGEKPDQLRTLEAHVRRMRKIEGIMEGWIREKSDSLFDPEINLSEVIYYRLEAEILLERCKDGTLKKLSPPISEAIDKEEKAERNQGKKPLDLKVQELLQAQAKAGKVEVQGRISQFEEGRGTLEFLLAASLRFLRAELAVSDKNSDQLRALQDHFDRMKKIQGINQERFNQGRISIMDLAEAKYYRSEAEIWLEQAKGGVWNFEP